MPAGSGYPAAPCGKAPLGTRQSFRARIRPPCSAARDPPLQKPRRALLADLRLEDYHEGFQSTPDAFMAIRLLGYVALLLGGLVRARAVTPAEGLPAVLPL